MDVWKEGQTVDEWMNIYIWTECTHHLVESNREPNNVSYRQTNT